VASTPEAFFILIIMKNKKKEAFFKSLKVLTPKELKETRNPNYKYLI